MVTAEEILEKKFDKKFNGYDPMQVDEFLDRILNTLEALKKGEGDRAERKPKTEDWNAPRQAERVSPGEMANMLEQAERRAQEIMNATNENAAMIVSSAQNRARALSEEAKINEKRIMMLREALREFMRDQMLMFDEKIDSVYRTVGRVSMEREER